MYAAARASRLTAGWATTNGSADTELHSSLTSLRSRSRALVRDAAYAKRARVIVQNNVVGSGIGMQAQVVTTRGELATRINDAVEREWKDWARANACHTGGAVHFADIERMMMGQVFEAGEVLVRKHYRKFGDSRVPIALEVIESERIADDYQLPQLDAASRGTEIRMGIEVDRFGRAQSYWLRERHPSEISFRGATSEQLVRVPASEIIHLRIIDRWPQTRGEPWLHAVARKLNDMDGYTEAEIIAARGAASYMGFIKTEDMDGPVGEPQADGTEQMELAPGTIPKLGPGEEFQGYSPNRPNSALDPFLRYMLREVAAGLSVSYESLSRDYSQSNYSSSRLSLLDDRDVWRMLQQWFIRSFRQPLHREWLEQAVMAGAISEIDRGAYAGDPDKFRAVLFKPRGWSWIDPTKEVEAAKASVMAGFTTVSRVIANTADGLDIEDIITERKRELELFEAADIEVDTTVVEPVEPAEPAPIAAPAAEDDPEDQAARQARIAEIGRQLTDAIIAAEVRGEHRGIQDSTAEAIANIARAIAEHPAAVVNVAPAAVTVGAPVVNVEPAQITVPAPIVNVAAAEVRVPATVVNVAAPEAPIVNVAAAEAPVVNVASPTVNVEPAQVRVTPAIEVKLQEPKRRKRVRKVTEWTTDGLPKTVEETDG
jgi:lambda family phage portal protein